MANRTILYQILVLISLISCGKSNDSQQAAERKADSIKYRAEIRRIGNNERGELKKQTLIKLIPILKEKKLDYHLFLAYTNLFYNTQPKMTEAAKAERKKILSITEELGKNTKNPAVKGLYYSLLAENEITYGDDKKAFKYLLKTIEITKNTDKVTYINAINMMGLYAIELQDYDTVISYAEDVLEFSKKNKEYHDKISNYYEYIAKHYAKKNDFSKAEKYLDSAIYARRKYGYSQPEVNVYNYTLGCINYSKGNDDIALRNFNENLRLIKLKGLPYDVDTDMEKVKIFEKQNKKDSILHILNTLQKFEKDFINIRSEAALYFPYKIKYSNGEERKKAMEDFLKLQKDILEENSGILAAKYHFEQEKKEQKHQYEAKVEKQKRKNIIIILSSSIIGIVLLNIIFFLSRKNIKLEHSNRELKLNILNTKFEAITKERDRISKELHDDLGATFTSISMATQFLRNENYADAKYVDIISRNTAKMNQKVNEIIWSLNTRNDTVGSLVSYITNFANNFFEGSSIRLSIIRKEEVAQLENNFFPSDKRRSLYLAAKEIINNAAKHSDAEQVLLEFYVEQDKLCIKIADDGKGINDAEQSKGNGLKNITDRITDVGAEYSCLTGAFGTSYTLKTKIAKR